MQVQQVSFVPVSEIFTRLPLAHEIFYEADIDGSFGDNTRSLVKPSIVQDMLAGRDIGSDENEVVFSDLAEGDETEREVRVATDRLKDLPVGVLVDLEN